MHTPSRSEVHTPLPRDGAGGMRILKIRAAQKFTLRSPAPGLGEGGMSSSSEIADIGDIGVASVASGRARGWGTATKVHPRRGWVPATGGPFGTIIVNPTAAGCTLGSPTLPLLLLAVAERLVDATPVSPSDAPLSHDSVRAGTDWATLQTAAQSAAADCEQKNASEATIQ